MLKFEQVRLDPSPGDIVETLSEAVLATNKRCRTRLLEDDTAKFRKTANLSQNTREGFDFWRAGRGGVPASQVMLSWWTDPLGRKHVVVRGRRCEHDGAKCFLERTTLGFYPALWHCYPSRVFLSMNAGAGEWVVVCGCGAAGTPDALQWMGDMCGPCHDAREERGEAALDHRVGILSGPRTGPSRVAISPNGQNVALSDLNGVFHVWTLADETRTEFKSESAYRDSDPYAARFTGSTLGFTGDSNFLINDYFVIGQQIVGLNLTKDVPEIIPLTAPAHAPNVIIPWTGSQFLRVWSDSLEWVDASTREPVRQVKVPVGNAWQAFPSHDYSRLFVRVGNRCTVIDPDDGVILLRPEIEDRQGMLYREEVPIYGVFSADYSRLVVAFHMHLQLIDGVSGRLLSKRIAYSNALLKKSYPDQVRGLHADHDTDLVWYGGAMGDVAAYRLSDLTPLGGFKWHMSGVADFSSTPDGRHFVTAGRDGLVKYWPLDRLKSLLKM